MTRHNPAHVIDWQTVAEQHEDTIKALTAERDETLAATCTDKDAHWRLDEALASLREANATVAALRAEQPRPLTPDAIESVLHDILPLTTEHLGADDIANIAFDLHAALTEPPKRPEGAEEIESAIRAWDENGDTNADHGDWDNLADFLASRGVRVITEDGAR